MSQDLSVALLGAIVGTTYGLLAVGLVLVYRSGRVINFAHGSVGAFAGSLFGALIVNGHLPYYLAMPLGMGFGALASILIEVAVMRRLRNSPSIVKIVATIGFATFFGIFALVVAPLQVTEGGSLHFPRPPGMPQFNIGPLNVSPENTAILVISPLLVLALAVFFRRTRVGVAIRAAAANSDAARLTGISANGMSTIAWGIAGALSGFTGILLFRSQSSVFSGATGMGPGLLLRGLAAAVLARMTSLPVAMVAGLGVGVLEEEILYRSPSVNEVNAVLLLVILAALLLQRRAVSGRQEDRGGWLSVQVPPAPEAYAPLLRRLGQATAVAGLGVGMILPVVISNSASVVMTAIMVFALLGLGLGVVSGLTGQLSLGQFGIAAAGAAASYLVVEHTGNFVIGLPCAMAVGTVISMLLGLPAVRIRGLMYAVITLGFALAVPWILERSWLFAVPEQPRQPILDGFPIDTSKRYYYFVLVFLVLSLGITHRVWRSAVGRRMRAVRDNEDAARSFSISATGVKLQAFGISGALAGLAGALYAHSLASVSASTFAVDGSLTAVAAVALGGLGSLIGPLLGAFYIIGVPRFLPLDTAGLAATSLGWLLLLIQFPGGVAQAVARSRDRLLERWAGSRWAPSSTPGSAPETTPAVAGSSVTRPPALPEGSVILRAEGLRRTYGGVAAVSDVSLEVRSGEILGLIGPNGAGKTTLFELLGGFARAESGTIVFKDHDVTGASPERRCRMGLVRSFQDAALFPTLTVAETVELAFERVSPTRLAPELAGWRRSSHQKEKRTRELIASFGLSRYRDTQISALSTGTRRITELACLCALEPDLLLLDEPTSGIAQRETEALAGVLRRMKEELGATLVVIEHDIPLIMGLSSRVVAMAAGTILTSGSPEAVRAHPDVVASYLGESDVAIARSDAGPALPLGGSVQNGTRCRATTRAGSRCSRPAAADGLCSQHAAREAVLV